VATDGAFEALGERLRARRAPRREDTCADTLSTSDGRPWPDDPMNALPWLITPLLLLPNVLWTLFRPRREPASEAERRAPSTADRAIALVEGVSRLLVLVLPFTCTAAAADPRPWVATITVAFGLYDTGWIRYFAGGRRRALLFAPLLGIPLPLAVAPVVMLLGAAALFRSWPLALSAAAFGAAHIASRSRQAAALVRTPEWPAPEPMGTVLWLIPPLTLVHNAEELLGGMLRLRSLQLDRLPAVLRGLAGTDDGWLLALAIVTALPWALAWFGDVGRRDSRGVRWLLGFQAVMALNVLTHVAGTVMLGTYSPGLVSALFLCVPFSITLFTRAWRDGWASRRVMAWYPLLALLAVGPGLLALLVLSSALLGA
jgi:hypothetical protein